MATRDRRQERRAALSLWQRYLLVLAEATQLKPFQTQRMDKCKQPKGRVTRYKQTHAQLNSSFVVLLQIPGALLPL